MSEGGKAARKKKKKERRGGKALHAAGLGSPSKSLKDINNMIRQGEQKAKKRVIAISRDAESPAKRLCQENDDVLLKRLQDVVSERANH